MYSSKQTVFFLVFFVALVSAIPLHDHHRRSKCHRRNTVSISSTVTSTRVAAEIPSYTSHPTPSSSAKPDSTKGTSKPKPSNPGSGSYSASDPSPSEPPSDAGSGSGGLLTGLLDDLFPVSDLLESWTTAPSNDALPLSDATFRPERVLQGLSHDYTNAPDGKKSMKAHYPAGSYNFGHNPKGGISFYAPGPSQVDLTEAKEVTFGYSVYFPEGFDFVKGGKLPGIYGGNSEDEAVGCSGGRRSDACFSARLMWRTDGAGEVYSYLPPSYDANEKVCNVKPQSDCNPTYGASIGRGAFKFTPGQWTTVTERIRLNDVGQENGEIQLFANGQSVINVSGLVLRNSEAGKMRGMQIQTFFGGSTPDFATPTSQDVYFSDFSVAITEKL